MILRKFLNCFLLFSFFVLSFAEAQTFQWAHSAGDWVEDFPKRTIFDQHGNVYITGHCFGGTTFDSFQAPSSGFYLTKYDPAGKVLWARFGSQSYNGQGVDLSLDKQGNIYATGLYDSPLDLGDTVLRANSTRAFLVKYNTTGALLWATNIGINSSNTWSAGGYVSVDQEENIYISGVYTHDLPLEDGIILNEIYENYSRDRDIFLVKLDKNGNILWGKPVGTSGDDRVVDMDIGPDNRIFLTLFTNGQKFTFGDTQYTIPREGCLMLSLDTEGRIEWLNTINGLAQDHALDEEGNIYITGYFYEQLDFDGDFLLTNENISSIFVAKYRPDKQVEWAKKIETEVTRPICIAASDGQVYIGGAFNGQIRSGEHSLQSDEQRGMFILKLNEVGYEQWMKLTGSHLADNLHSIAVSPQGAIAIAGEYAGKTMDLDGIRLHNNSGNSDTDIFVAVMDDPILTKCPAATPRLSTNKDVICAEEMAVLSADGTNDYPIQWYKDEQFVHRSLEKEFQITNAGNYYFVVYDGTDCAAVSNRISVREVAFPDQSLTVEPDFQTCNDHPVKIEAENHPDYSHQWYRNGELLQGQTKHFISATESGEYYAVLLNEGVCSMESEKVSVEILPEENDFLPDTVYKCLNEPAILYPDKLKHKEWNFMWSTNEITASIEPHQEGLYTLRVHKGECTYSDQVFVKNYEALWVPNVITPNGDEMNDVFKVENLSRPVTLSIYNRWGVLIYEDEAYQNTWSADGLDAGVYYYIIKDESGCWEENLLRGWLQVLR